MKTIWKFPIERVFAGTYGEFKVSMPFGAEPLSVGMQGGHLTIWAAVETNNTPEPKKFYIAGTGREMPPKWEFKKFIGMVHDGPFVWHVFEMA